MGTSYWVPGMKKAKGFGTKRRSYEDGFVAGLAVGKGIEDWPLIFRNDEAPAYVWAKEGEKEIHAYGDKELCNTIMETFEKAVEEVMGEEE